MDVAVKGILGIDTFLDLFVLISELLSLLDHFLNLLLRQPSLVISDRDFLTFASTLVLGSNIQNTIGIDFKSDLDLRLTTWRRWDTTELKLTKLMVVLCHWALTLKHLDVDRWLVILVS